MRRCQGCAALTARPAHEAFALIQCSGGEAERAGGPSRVPHLKRIEVHQHGEDRFRTLVGRQLWVGVAADRIGVPLVVAKEVLEIAGRQRPRLDSAGQELLHPRAALVGGAAFFPQRLPEREALRLQEMVGVGEGSARRVDGEPPGGRGFQVYDLLAAGAVAVSGRTPCAPPGDEEVRGHAVGPGRGVRCRLLAIGVLTDPIFLRF